MRKSTKLVVLVAALVALCSFAAFAVTGWNLEADGNWYYYDNDGNVVYGEWKKFGGSYFYLDDATGAMATNQLIDGEKTYWVGADGARVCGAWVQVPVDSSDDGYEWMYFGSTGAAYKDKINKLCPIADGTTHKYSFDSDGYMYYGYAALDGEALTSVDDIVDATYYYGEKTDGALKTSTWVEITDGTAKGHEDADSVWFFFGSNGKLVKAGTAKYNGKTYNFAEDGAMLSGWTEDDPASAATASYYNDGIKVKNDWIYTNNFYGGEDEDTYKWYWIGSENKPFEKGIYKIKKDGKFYAFNENAEMISGLVALKNTDAIDPKHAADDFDKVVKASDYASFAKFSAAVDDMADYQVYFFSNDYKNDGSMKTGAQTVEAFDDELALTFDKYGVALNGYKNKKIYQHGQLQSAGSDRIAVKKLTVASDDLKVGYYLVNASGALLKNYKGTDADGIFWVVKEYQDNYKFADKDYASQAATAVKAGNKTFEVRIDGKAVTFVLDIDDSTKADKGYCTVNWSKQ